MGRQFNGFEWTDVVLETDGRPKPMNAASLYRSLQLTVGILGELGTGTNTRFLLDPPGAKSRNAVAFPGREFDVVGVDRAMAIKLAASLPKK